MATALQLPPERRSKPAVPREIHLLAEYPSRWKDFADNLQAAFGRRSGEPGFEEALGRAPRGALASSFALHIAAVLMLVLLFPRIEINFPVVLDETPREQALIYYPVPSLPQVEDSSAGKAGGVAKAQSSSNAAFHPVQTIRVSRGSIIRPAVVDAPSLKLPRVTGATANILELPAVPAAAPQLAPQPVELARLNSKLARTSRQAEPASPILQRLPSVEKALPDLSIRTAAPTAAPEPIELARGKSKIGRAGVVPEENAPLLPAGQTIPVLASGGAPSVVVSVNTGDAVALPANGGSGSLAMSPEGRKQLNSGGAGKSGSTRDNDTGASAVPRKGKGPGESGGSAGANPAEGNGPESAAAGEGKAGVPAIPGVMVRGGVVTLESFGPKGPPANARQGTGTAAERPRKQAPITIVATSRSGGGLDVYGFFKSQRVYTIYIDTKLGPVVLQFAARDASTEAAGELTTPDPIVADLAPEQSRASAVISCVLGVDGSLKELRIVRIAAESGAAQTLLENVAAWRFHPALSRGNPVEVDALIGIRTGVH